MDPVARKGRVARVALDRLQIDGFASLTFEDVARAAELDEADLRALFGDLHGLMDDVVGPLRRRLREVVDSAARVDLRRPEALRAVVEQYVDALAEHRTLVGAIVADASSNSWEPVLGVRAAMSDLRDELARGTAWDTEHRIRASSALGAVQAAVLELADVDPAILRDVTVSAAVAILLS